MTDGPGGEAARAGRRGQLGFLLLLLLYGLVLAASLGGLSADARLFPLLLLAAAALLWAVKLAATLAPPRLKSLIEPRGILPRVRPAGSETGGGAAHRNDGWLLWAWLVGSLVAMLGLGFLAGSALSVLVYTRLIARAAWPAALLAMAATALFIQLVFAEALLVDLGPVPPGLLLKP